MKFKDSMTVRIAPIAESAEKIWGDWDILWEISFENMQSQGVQFLAVREDRYCLASLNVPTPQYFYFGDSHPKDVSVKKLKEQSKFFEDMSELIQYAKSIKKKYDLEQKIHLPKKDLLLAIKREFDSRKDEIDFKTKHHNRLSRVD